MRDIRLDMIARATRPREAIPNVYHRASGYLKSGRSTPTSIKRVEIQPPGVRRPGGGETSLSILPAYRKTRGKPPPPSHRGEKGTV
jgi:hypothetical protein